MPVKYNFLPIKVSDWDLTFFIRVGSGLCKHPWPEPLPDPGIYGTVVFMSAQELIDDPGGSLSVPLHSLVAGARVLCDDVRAVSCETSFGFVQLPLPT